MQTNIKFYYYVTNRQNICAPFFMSRTFRPCLSCLWWITISKIVCWPCKFRTRSTNPFPVCDFSLSFKHVVRMDSQPHVSDKSSDCSTEIIVDNTSFDQPKIISHHKISVVKMDIKIDLETKNYGSSNVNLVCILSLDEKWLNLVEKLCSASS